MAKTQVVGGIIRVSTRRQAEESDSPANQRQFLSSQGATRFYEYVGSGFAVEKRRSSTAWQELVQDIRNGVLSRLLATDISRAARKDELLTELIELCDQCGVEFQAAGLRVSHDTAMGWYSAKQMSLIAELYSRDLSDRIKRGQAAAIARGVPAFTSKHLPWHLMRDPDKRHGVLPDPERWPLARQLVLDYIQGRDSLDGMSKRVYERFGVMSTASAMHKWLRSHSLQGHYGKRDGPVLISSCFPALINAEETEQLQRRLEINRKRWGTTSTHRIYALTGLCRCLHCERAMVYTTVRKPKSQELYCYLRCALVRSCPGFRRNIPGELVEMAVLHRLNHVTLAGEAATMREPAVVPIELVKLQHRVQKLRELLKEVYSPGVRADLQEATERLEILQSQNQALRRSQVDQLQELQAGGDNGFMSLPHGTRNSVLLRLVDHALVDTTYTPVGGGWENLLVPQIVLR